MHKIGIVFSGGIAKGAYQIGFCKAFESLIPKDKIVAISGSSIGAWNAAMLLHSSTKSAEEAWINIDIKGLRQVIKILFSRLFLYKQLDNCVDLSVLYSSKIDFFVTCMELPYMEVKYLKTSDFSCEEINNLLYASIAIPGIIEPAELNGKKYVDAGLRENIPIKPVYEAGADLIFVVHFDATQPIDYSIYPNARIVEIVLDCPNNKFLKSSFDFSKENVSYLINKGYEDSYMLLDLIFKHGFENMEYIESTIDFIHSSRKKKKISSINNITGDYIINRINRIG